MNISRILRISKLELKRESGIINKRVAFIVLASIVLITGTVTVFGVSSPEENMYSVGVSQDSIYEPALNEHSSLDVRVLDETDKDTVDAYVLDNGEIQVIDNKTGRLAANEIKEAVNSYNYKLMRNERNTAAAFPVRVEVQYLSPENEDLEEETIQTESQNRGTQESDSSDFKSGERITENKEPQVTQTENDGSSLTEETRGENTEIEDSTSSQRSDEIETVTPQEQVPESNENLNSSGTITPNELNPPLPFESLIFGFALLLPLNFISQVYSSSLITERDNKKGEMLLVSPASKYDIIIGKTLPYLLLSILIVGLLLAIAGGSFVSLVGILPLIIMFLSFAFLASSFARSYKELSFFTLGSSVLITVFAFIPAVFTQVHPISSITPLSIVITDLQNSGFEIRRFLMGTIPLFFTGSVVFVFGIETYEQEFLFSRESLSNKFFTMIAHQVVTIRSLFVLGALSIPFVFIAELLVLTGLISIPGLFSIPVLLVILAVIEEVGKSLPIYAGQKYAKIEDSVKILLICGFVSGLGFFFAEKIFVLAQQAGLNSLELGSAAFMNSLLPAFSGDSPVGLLLLILWPFLHSITTMISALGMRKGRVGYIIGIGGATVVHVGYNLTAVMIYA